MKPESILTRGRTLDHAAFIYDFCEPILLLGKQAEYDRQIISLIEKIGLPDAAATLPRELSGGEIQRVAAARAMAHCPKILLADEPTASLDTATGKNLIQLIFDMGEEQGCTLVIATHDPEIFHLAEITVHLRDGRFVKPEGL